MVVDKYLFFCFDEWFINLLIHAYQYKILLTLFHHFSFHSCCSCWILVLFRFVSHFNIFRSVLHFSIFRFVALRFIIFRFASFRSVAFRFLIPVQYNPYYNCDFMYFYKLSLIIYICIIFISSQTSTLCCFIDL